MTEQQQLDGFCDLLIAIRHARAAFIRSGRPRQYWDALCAGIRTDFHSGVPLAQIARVVESWTQLLNRREARTEYLIQNE
jgi:hypothetical protein